MRPKVHNGNVYTVKLPCAVFILLFLITINICVPFQAAAEVKEVTILFSGDTRGRLLECAEEEKKGWGSFAARASLIARERSRGTVIYLDSGNMLGPTEINDYDRGELAIRLMERLKPDAVLVGPGEFAYGDAVFARRKLETSFPFVSTNLFLGESRRPFAKPYIVREVDGLRIAVIGLTDRKIEKIVGSRELGEFRVMLPFIAMTRIQKDIKDANYDCVVVLCQMNRPDTVEFTQLFPFVDMVISSGYYESFLNEAGENVFDLLGGRIVVTVPSNGYYLGRIEMQFEREGRKTEISHIRYSTLPAGPEVKPDEEISRIIADQVAHVKAYKQREAMIHENGSYIAAALRDYYNVPVALIHRNNVAPYSPPDTFRVDVVDSLIMKNDILLKTSLLGKDMEQLFIKSKDKRTTPDEIFIAGITEDARIHSIPIIETEYYDVILPSKVFLGAGDYSEVTRADSVRDLEVDIAGALRQYMEVKIAEEERKKPKPKAVTGIFNFRVEGTFVKSFRNSEVGKYSDISADISEKLSKVKSQYAGSIIFRSDKNIFKFNYKKIHTFTLQLDLEYGRTATKTPLEPTIYRESTDDAKFYSTYIMDVKETWFQPTIKINFNSNLYEKHRYPLSVNYTAGASRNIFIFSKLFKTEWFKIEQMRIYWGGGFKRDYVTNKNSMTERFELTGIQMQALKGWVLLTSRVDVDYFPMAMNHLKVFGYNKNTLTIKLSKLTKKIDIVVTNTNYLHRDSRLRKIAYINRYNTGLSYNFIDKKEVSF